MDEFVELIASIQAGDLSKVRQLVEGHPELIEGRTTEGVSPILMALYYNEPEIARFLIDSCTLMDIYEAAACGKSIRVKAILDAEPEVVNSYAPDGFTPLTLACFFGRQTVTEMLLARGADVNLPARNAARVQPLHSAVAARQFAIVERLLQSGADINAQQQDGFTALHAAAQNGQYEMVQLLIDYGADATVQTAAGKTAFDYALEGGNPEILQLLQNRM
jgi:ankyrin repeat protein